MITVRSANFNDIETITKLGTTTFLETYLVNTPKEAVENFIEKAFDKDTLAEELQHTEIFYHLIYLENTLVGYSKIVLNSENEHIHQKPITKLDRFYVLKEFHGKGLGKLLFNFFVNFTKKQAQQGMWLYVLIENERAVNFYTKNNFKIAGYHDFVVSDTCTNPNHVMFLEY